MEQLFKVVWKSTAAFITLILLSRIIGKKLLSQMSFFDFVVGIVMGTVAGTFITAEVQGR